MDELFTFEAGSRLFRCPDRKKLRILQVEPQCHWRRKVRPFLPFDWNIQGVPLNRLGNAEPFPLFVPRLNNDLAEMSTRIEVKSAALNQQRLRHDFTTVKRRLHGDEA